LDDLTPELLLDERGLTAASGFYPTWVNQGTAAGTITAGVGARPAEGSTINGLPAPSFDGDDDLMTAPGLGSAYATLTEFEGFLVVNLPSLRAEGSPHYESDCLIATSNPAPLIVYATPDGAFLGIGSPWTTSTRGAVLYADSVPRIISFRMHDGNIYVRVDYDNETVIESGPCSTLASVFYLMCNYSTVFRTPGTMAMAFLKKAALTPIERSAALRFISQKYGTCSYVGAKEICFMGDSITACSQPLGAQWRKRVSENYAARVDNIKFYRPSGFGAGANLAFPEDRCWAGGGYTVATMRTSFTTFGLGVRYKPDIIAIMLGTNDIQAGSSAATLATAYAAMLVDINARIPGVKLVVQHLTPRGDGSNSVVTSFNALIPGIVADAAALGMNIIEDSTFATLSGVAYMDEVHPALVSGDLIGDAMEPRTRIWAGVV
jgi:hypothetical protein